MDEQRKGIVDWIIALSFFNWPLFPCPQSTTMASAMQRLQSACWRTSLRKDHLSDSSHISPSAESKAVRKAVKQDHPSAPDPGISTTRVNSYRSSKTAHQFIQVSWTVSSKPCFSMEQNGALPLSFSYLSYLYLLQWTVEPALTIQSWTKTQLCSGLAFMLQHRPYIFQFLCLLWGTFCFI